MKYRVVVIIAFIVFSTACTKELPLKLNDTNINKIVVNALFQPDSVMKIHIGTTASMGQKMQNIDNATIYLYQGDELLQSPAHIGDGWYTTFIYPLTEVNYSIKVELEGYESVTASSKIPALPYFEEDPYLKRVGRVVIEGDPQIAYNTHCVFTDSASDQNRYYEIYLGSLVFSIHEQTDPSLLMDSDLDIKDHIPSLIFSNSLFRNNKKHLVINGLGSLFDFSHEPHGNSPDQYLDKMQLRLKFHAVSKEYFEYRKGSNRHFYLQQNTQFLDDPITLLFLGSPVEMYTNIKGGYGIFAGFSVKQFYINYINQ